MTCFPSFHHLHLLGVPGASNRDFSVFIEIYIYFLIKLGSFHFAIAVTMKSMKTVCLMLSKAPTPTWILDTVVCPLFSPTPMPLICAT